MKLERRLFTLEIRSEGDAPKICGHAAVFNTPADLGYFREQIAPGAFREAIGRDDVKCLFNHDSNCVLGRNRAGTLRLSEDEVGLYFECDPPDTQWGRDVITSMQRGDITQCSFGFIPTKQQWDESGDVPLRTIKNCQLFDVSPVTYPAYDSTDCQARSAADVLQEHRSAAPADFQIELDAKFARLAMLCRI
jgi:HK97 family phage prohead protease